MNAAVGTLGVNFDRFVSPRAEEIDDAGLQILYAQRLTDSDFEQACAAVGVEWLVGRFESDPIDAKSVEIGTQDGRGTRESREQ